MVRATSGHNGARRTPTPPALVVPVSFRHWEALAPPAAGGRRLGPMDGTHAAASPLLSIGDLARRTGLPVRTIRYWSETGVVPEATRSAAGTGSTTRPAWPDWSWWPRCGSSAEPCRGPPRAEPREHRGRGGGDPCAGARRPDRHAAAAPGRAVRRRRRGPGGARTHGSSEPFGTDVGTGAAADHRRLRSRGLRGLGGRAAAAGPAQGAVARRRPPAADAPTQDQLDAWLELSELMQDQEFRRLARRAVERSSEPDRHRFFSQNLDRTVGAAMREGVEPDSRGRRPSSTSCSTAPARIVAGPSATGSGPAGRGPRRPPGALPAPAGGHAGPAAPSTRSALYAWLADAIDAGAAGPVPGRRVTPADAVRAGGARAVPVKPTAEQLAAAQDRTIEDVIGRICGCCSAGSIGALVGGDGASLRPARQQVLAGAAPRRFTPAAAGAGGGRASCSGSASGSPTSSPGRPRRPTSSAPRSTASAARRSSRAWSGGGRGRSPSSGSGRTGPRRRPGRRGRQEEGLGGTEVWVLPNPSGLNAHRRTESRRSSAD